MIYEVGTDTRLTAAYFAIRSAEVKTFTADIEGRTGYELSCSVIADLAVEARASGDVAWINLETTPIDLSPYNATRQTFEFRLTAGTITTRARRAFSLRVSR